MPCTRFKSADGKVFGFVCSRGGTRSSLPCVVCGRPSTKLCDGPKGSYPGIITKEDTCSAPLCDAHAFHVEPGKDYCPKCRERMKP